MRSVGLRKISAEVVAQQDVSAVNAKIKKSSVREIEREVPAKYARAVMNDMDRFLSTVRRVGIKSVADRKALYVCELNDGSQFSVLKGDPRTDMRGSIVAKRRVPLWRKALGDRDMDIRVSWGRAEQPSAKYPGYFNIWTHNIYMGRGTPDFQQGGQIVCKQNPIIMSAATHFVTELQLLCRLASSSSVGA